MEEEMRSNALITLDLDLLPRLLPTFQIEAKLVSHHITTVAYKYLNS